MRHFFKNFPRITWAAFFLVFGMLASGHISRLLQNEDVQNTVFPGAFAGFGSSNLFIFNDYTSWTNSTTLKTSDTIAQVLYLGGGTASPLNFVDFNGDGLIDVIYINNSTSYNRSAVFLNNGSGNFDLFYKCAYVSATARYYGDCAG